MGFTVGADTTFTTFNKTLVQPLIPVTVTL
jgi:hypothetical protein